MEHLRPDTISYATLADGIEKGEILSSDHVQILSLVLQSGKQLQPHDMPSRVIFYVRAGTGIFNYDGDDNVVETGEMIDASPGKLRYWRNDASQPLKLLVVKSLQEQ